MLSNFALLDIARRWNLRLSIVNTAFVSDLFLLTFHANAKKGRAR